MVKHTSTKFSSQLGKDKTSPMPGPSRKIPRNFDLAMRRLNSQLLDGKSSGVISGSVERVSKVSDTTSPSPLKKAVITESESKPIPRNPKQMVFNSLQLKPTPKNSSPINSITDRIGSKTNRNEDLSLNNNALNKEEDVKPTVANKMNLGTESKKSLKSIRLNAIKLGGENELSKKFEAKVQAEPLLSASESPRNSIRSLVSSAFKSVQSGITVNSHSPSPVPFNLKETVSLPSNSSNISEPRSRLASLRISDKPEQIHVLPTSLEKQPTVIEHKIPSTFDNENRQTEGQKKTLSNFKLKLISQAEDQISPINIESSRPSILSRIGGKMRRSRSPSPSSSAKKNKPNLNQKPSVTNQASRVHLIPTQSELNPRPPPTPKRPLQPHPLTLVNQQPYHLTRTSALTKVNTQSSSSPKGIYSFQQPSHPSISTQSPTTSAPFQASKFTPFSNVGNSYSNLSINPMPGSNSAIRCKFLFSCTRLDCPYFHPKEKCFNGDICSNHHCRFLHPRDLVSNLCKFDTTCTRTDCRFFHMERFFTIGNPSSILPIPCQGPCPGRTCRKKHAGQKLPFVGEECLFYYRCNRNPCPYTHHEPSNGLRTDPFNSVEASRRYKDIHSEDY